MSLGQHSRGGQAVVEYILLSLVLVIIATAVLSPLRDRFAAIQADLAVNTFSVVAQDELGIPLRWFDLEGENDTSGKFDSLLANLNTAGEVPTEGGARARPAGPGTQAGDDNNPAAAGGDTPAAGAGGPQATGRGTGSDAATQAGASGSSTASSAAGAEDEAGRASGGTRLDRGSSGGGGADASSGGTSAGADNQGQDSEKTAAEQAAEEEKEGAGGARNRIYDGRTEEQRKGGCQDVDWATLLKILAILGIVVIGAIMALSGRGGGKNAK